MNPVEQMIRDSKAYESTLSGYQKQTLIQWQVGANALASTLQLHGTINENELLFYMNEFESFVPFLLSAQARLFIEDTPWFESQSAGRKRDIRRRLNEQPIWSEAGAYAAQTQFSWQKEDIITEIMESFQYKYIEGTHAQYQLPMPQKSKFVSQIFQLPGYKEQIQRGKVRIGVHVLDNDWMKSLREVHFGPFSFEQILQMTRLFVDDLQAILKGAPKIKDPITLYRGLKNDRIVPVTKRSLIVPTFQSFSSDRVRADMYVDANPCCLEKLIVPVGTPVYQLSVKLRPSNSFQQDSEIIMPSNSNQLRTDGPHATQNPPVRQSDTQYVIP